MDTKQVTVKLGSDAKQTKPTNTKKNNKTQPTVDLSKEFVKAKEENKTTLNLSKNNITVIPSSIKDLTNLVELYLYGNKINMLPPEIGNLTQLQTLALNENQVSSIFNSFFF
jgi:leucine-rich repeat protein SHOC2